MIESEKTPELLYYCERLNARFSRREGCETNVQRARALQTAGLWLGPLEHCLECQGRELQMPAGEIAIQVPDKSHCPNHPDRLKHKRAAVCLECLRERAKNTAAIKRAKRATREEAARQKEKIPPGAPVIKGGDGQAHVEDKDLHGKVHLSVAEAEKMLGPEKVAAVFQEPEMKPLSPEQIREGRAAVARLGQRFSGTQPTCKEHPDQPSVIDRLGRDTRYCRECHQARGRASGMLAQKKGLTGPPVAIPLNQEKYAGLKKWLQEQAEDNERSLNQEIMFRLKQARAMAEKAGS